jgi:hypothetical protein
MAIPLGQFVEQQAAIAGRNGRGSGMVTRLAMVVLILLAAGSACAESLTPDAARRFVTGKLFAFNCFDGSRGAGRIYGDGSVIGTIQFRGAGPARTVSLPAGTLRVRGEAVCASLQGMAFEPCFHLEKTTERSFRGSWMGFAYCDFTQRMSVAGMSPRRNSSEPLSLEAAAEPAGPN